MLLFKACKAKVAYIEERYWVSGLLVDFAKKQQAAQLSGLITEDGL